MLWSAELTWGAEETNQAEGTAFYNESESSTFAGQKYLHVRCPVSGQCLGNIRGVACVQTVFVVNSSWTRYLLEVTDSIHPEYKTYLCLFIALCQAHVRTKICLAPAGEGWSEGLQKQISFMQAAGVGLLGVFLLVFFPFCREFNYLRVTLEMIVYWVKKPFLSLMKATKSLCGDKWKMIRGFVCAAPLHAPSVVSVHL